jgi:acyl-CoA reductase-like NAD-dependent aldehyde dehydrogenase
VRNPQDGTLVDTVPKAGREQMRRAVSCAVEASGRWRRAPR